MARLVARAAAGDGTDDLEWKVRMLSGATLVYSWTVDAPPEEFYSDLHGESAPAPEVKVVTYRKGADVASNGAIVAPFDGIHGCRPAALVSPASAIIARVRSKVTPNQLAEHRVEMGNRPTQPLKE